MCINRKRKVVILVPYPAQGHVTPMLKLGSVLATLGFQSILVVPEFIHRLLSPRRQTIKSPTSLLLLDDGKVSCISIPDGLDEETPRDFFAIEMAMEKHMPFHLEEYILGQLLSMNNNSNDIVMVVDLLASYAIDVGHRCRLEVVGFWPAMLSVYHLISAIPHLVFSGVVSHDSGLPIQEGPIQSLSHAPDQPPIYTEHLPWLIGSPSTRTARFKFWINTLNRSSKLDHLLANSFPDIDNNNNNNDDNHNVLPRILPIGHLINSHGTSKEASIFEEDFSCLEWLNNQQKGTVVYVSFGSWVSPIGEDKVKSLAKSLKAMRRPFIWVLGQSWREGLPTRFFDEVEDRGRIVSWAPQLEILRHEAVGFYLTHCGWNSTVEAIKCRKRMLCFPVAGDQFLNCAYIVKTWRIGVRLNGLEEHDVAEGFTRLSEDLVGMSQRIMELNERFMGFDSGYKMMSNNLEEVFYNLQSDGKAALIHQ